MKYAPAVFLLPTGLFFRALLFCALWYRAGFPAETDTTLYVNDPDSLLSKSTLSILAAPLPAVTEQFINNTAKGPAAPAPGDSFFVEAANGLIAFECSKLFRIGIADDACKQAADSLRPCIATPWSILAADTADALSLPERVRTVAAACNADLVLIPRSCAIDHITFQQQGWRDAPSYQRPVHYISRTRIHLQIWDKNGNLVYERIGKDRTTRPVLYSLLKRESPGEGEEITAYAKRYFSQPAIRSLAKSIADALSIHPLE